MEEVMKHPENSSSPQSGHSSLSSSLNRRRFLIGMSSFIGATATHWLLSPGPAQSQGVYQDPTKIPGRPASIYGTRSNFAASKRFGTTDRSLTPLQDLHGIVTPSALHFERHHNGIPHIDPTHHRLLIHGLVNQPMTYTIEELQRFPAVSRLAFIECSGNTGKEWKKATGSTVQHTHGLTSTSEWTGVALSTLIREVGLHPTATWMLAEGSDAAALTRSLPVEAMSQEAILCYAQNGEALRPEQGYPLRLLLPGWEGNACIKWVRRLKFMAEPAMTREETSKYTDLMPDGTARQFTFEMEAKSVITSPSGGQHLTQRGFVEIRGLAWSGRGRITQVEVSTNGGNTWTPAELQNPILPKCHTRFRFPWHWNGQETFLQSRCVDETGYRQPTLSALVHKRGTHSYYHNNAIQSWHIFSDGHIENVHI